MNPFKNQSRREFLKKTGSFSLALGAAGLFPLCSQGNSEILNHIHLYKINVLKPRHFSWGTWKSRQHIIVKFTAGNKVAFSEMIADTNHPELELSEWGLFLNDLKNLNLNEILIFLRSIRGNQQWHKKKIEMTELAIWDLLGQHQNKPSVHLLGLKKNDPVPGLYCVLEDDPKHVRSQIQLGLKQNYTTHFKVKLFGNIENDIEIVRAARKAIGKEAFLMGDANRGYKSWSNLNELAQSINQLAENGLDALEDPSQLTINEFVELNNKLDLSLIPDFIMRPSWDAVNKIVQGMGKYYNLHPSTMGDIRDMIRMKNKVQSWGAGLMIGDNSLIGPGCTIWQQIAIASGADWVEAIEKPFECDTFINCIQSKSTYRTQEGRIGMNEKPGFGLEVNETCLKKSVDEYYQVF